MNQPLQVQERHSPLWKYTALGSTVLAIILFLIYWNMTDVFWSGIVRLASFASFAGAIMSGLKAMESGLKIDVSASGSTLNFIYYKRGNSIHEHSQELSNITSIVRVKPESRLTGETVNEFVIRFKDSEQDYDLFHFGGRTLQFENAEADKLIDFFHKHSIPFSNGVTTSNT